MLVSVIIPCYNVEQYIEECVESVFQQTYTNVEIICVNNNSTDLTWSKLLQLKEQFSHIIIDREKKPGAPAARNKGLALAKGEWIQFLDADDLLLPKKIAHQVNLIRKNPQAVFIAGGALKRLINKEEKIFLPQKNDPFKALFITALGNSCSNVWNKGFLEQIGGWDETLKSSQETDLMFRLLQKNQDVIFDPEPYTVIRERESGQISQRNPQEKWLQYFQKRIEISEWIKKNLPESYEEDYNFYQSSLFAILRLLSKYDLKLASKLNKKYINSSFRPLDVNNKKGTYYYLYKALGFETAERVSQTLRPLHKS